jgi:hypothetical protein
MTARGPNPQVGDAVPEDLSCERWTLLGSHGKDIQLGAADHEAEVFEKAADMVLEMALDLDQQPGWPVAP